jgi:hypothetical protein
MIANGRQATIQTDLALALACRVYLRLSINSVAPDLIADDRAIRPWFKGGTGTAVTQVDLGLLAGSRQNAFEPIGSLPNPRLSAFRFQFVRQLQRCADLPKVRQYAA